MPARAIPLAKQASGSIKHGSRPLEVEVNSPSRRPFLARSDALFPMRPESVPLRGACVPRGELMATTVRETLADFGRFDPELHAPEPRRLRPAYGFDDIAIVPGVDTL